MLLAPFCYPAKIRTCGPIETKSCRLGHPRGTAPRGTRWMGLTLFVMGALFLSGPLRVLADETATPQIRAARKLFGRYCIRCHGNDGRGGPGRSTMPAIPNFTDPSWQQSRSNPQLVISILEGKDRLMPANRGPVSDQQAVDLVAFIRTFGPAGVARPGPDSTQAGSTDFDVKFNQLVKEWDDLDRQARELASAPATEPSPKGNIARASAPAGPAPYFKQNCAGCHTIGGGALTGPDLKHVIWRKDRDWLVQLLLNPKAVIHGGDPYALALLARSRGEVMPHRFGMTRHLAGALLDFIEDESKKSKSQFVGLPIPDRPLTPSDAARGRELFAGRLRLANGGTACIACHTVHGTGAAEGGRLGPELTKVYERVGGRNALTAHLWAAATPTMQPLYKDHPLEPEEVLSLTAYLAEADREGVEDASAIPLNFLLLGLGGTVVGLGAVNVLWGIGFRPQSRPAPNGKLAAALGSQNERLPPSQGQGPLPTATLAVRPDPAPFPEEFAVPSR
jgi:mono/diheme cytochrome c family protein